MLSKKDIALLKGMFEDLKTDVRDEFRSCISASEARITARMNKLERDISQVAADAAEMIGESVLPRIEALEYRTDKIEKHLQLV